MLGISLRGVEEGQSFFPVYRRRDATLGFGILPVGSTGTLRPAGRCLSAHLPALGLLWNAGKGGDLGARVLLPPAKTMCNGGYLGAVADPSLRPRFSSWGRAGRRLRKNQRQAKPKTGHT